MLMCRGEDNKKKKLIEDTVDMLDKMTESGVGHINIDIKDSQGEKEIKIFKSNDSAERCFSCRIPNLNYEDDFR